MRSQGAQVRFELRGQAKRRQVSRPIGMSFWVRKDKLTDQGIEGVRDVDEKGSKREALSGSDCGKRPDVVNAKITSAARHATELSRPQLRKSSCGDLGAQEFVPNFRDGGR